MEEGRDAGFVLFCFAWGVNELTVDDEENEASVSSLD